MRRAVVLASLIATFALASLPAKAEGFLFARHPKVDQRVATVSLGVGAASTAAYFIAKDGHGVDWGAYGVATVGCMVLGPMIAAAMVPERELTSREVLVMQGACIVPIVGGLLVNALFDANPQWESPPPRARRVAVRR
jgi:peptidoglycan/LPS O-acetylase OafA/YrhL